MLLYFLLYGGYLVEVDYKPLDYVNAHRPVTQFSCASKWCTVVDYSFPVDTKLNELIPRNAFSTGVRIAFKKEHNYSILSIVMKI